ncbi:hypothetical protein RT21_21400 [Pseudomonas sp. 10B238]|uniref:hypothetical protein n=1 Tax=Stutzerimonas zhaodongensis TaxID=1176257 RepID=UPI00061801B9|nr:hypothetical protein [Stutzerimonas zhaodongensis]KJJ61215.1 hypothetical protein RT21_21400 [Pseudomonas sp. 10B238]MCQ2029871.1 hypothetical protein [Stutzerimonas zhaodongensis]
MTKIRRKYELLILSGYVGFNKVDADVHYPRQDRRWVLLPWPPSPPWLSCLPINKQLISVIS